MSTTTVLILVIALGYFAALVWFRDRIIRWKAIGFGLFGLLLVGLVNIAIALLGIILGWIHLTAEFDIHLLGSSIAYFLLLATLVCLFQAMLPEGIGIHRLWPDCLSDDSSETETSSPPD